MKKVDVAFEARWSMDPGVSLPLVKTYLRNFTAQGYEPRSVRGHSLAARHFLVWLHRSKIALKDVDDGIVERFADHRCKCPGGRQGGELAAGYIHRVRQFVRFLAEKNVVRTPDVEPIDPRIAIYLEWLRSHCGLAEETIEDHHRLVARLLPALGNDTAAYDASLIRRIILKESRKLSSVRLKRLASVLRIYLRFLAARGECRPWLDRAVPQSAHWRLATLPRYISTAAVEKVIASCDLTTSAGIRDRAILLLLARLGLRGGDVLKMRLDDIEWKAGALRVRGKGRREVRLPLPQDVGDALLTYLAKARPKSDSERLFLRSRAPYRPFTESGAISKIVCGALARARIDNAPSRGAHLLRHSVATAMLRAGATLDTIGAVLRHRSIDTTAHYAKVDIPALRQIAQPWPGGVSC